MSGYSTIRILLVVLLAVGGLQKVVAQSRWSLGTGVTYCNYLKSPGLNVNISYRIFGNLHIGPDFSALLSKETEEDGNIVKRKEVEYNLNSHYILRINESVSLYPLAGINLSKLTVHPAGKLPDKKLITAFNAGGGFELEFVIIRLFIESKWVSKFDKVDVTAGILFDL